MAVTKILLPYNFAQKDRKAMQFVIDTFRDRPEVRITLFHAFTPLPAIDVSGALEKSKLGSNMSYLQQKISELESTFRSVRLQLVQNGFSETQVKALFKPRKKEVAAEILELNRIEIFDLIVLSHMSRKIKQFFTGSVPNRLLAELKDTTVCIVT